MRRKQKQKLLLVCLFILGLISTLQRYLYPAIIFVSHEFGHDFAKHKFPHEQLHFNINKFTIYSKCLCHKEVITVTKQKNNIYLIEVTNISTNNGTQTLYYNLSKEYFESHLSCDLYKVLRRGPNQNVVSFTVKENEVQNHFEYVYFPNIKDIVKNNYKNWTARVYYDTKQLDQNMICHYECSDEKKIDFCDVSYLPLGSNKKWDASFMKPSTRRWLPFGDWLVDIFVSRDYDSCVSDREMSAVRNWIKSKNLFHVMRDHPTHDRPIISGMWGFVTYLNRELSEKLFHILIENSDSELITLDRFWPIFKDNCTIHDSFYCSKKEYGNSEPFPTKRSLDNCYVGQYGCCGSEFNSINSPVVQCPIECRPKDKANQWLFC